MNSDLFHNEPLGFSSRDDLLQYLRSSIVAAGVEDFLSRPTWTLQEIAERSVDWTTVRTIRTRNYWVAPLMLVRRWAQAYLGQHWRDFVAASDAEAYQAALDVAVVSLQSEFATATRLRARALDKEPYKLTYGRAAKMIGLMLKHIALCDVLSAAERRAFFGRVHVALDRYTLAAAAQLAPELRLRSQPSMGDVEARDAYLAVQGWIAAVCAEAGVPPSTYEVGLFNLPRGEWHVRPSTTPTSDIPPGVRSQATLSGRATGQAPRHPGAGRSNDQRAQQRRRPAHKRAIGTAPRATRSASAISRRRVEQRPVIEVSVASGASYRNTTLSVCLEVVDTDDLAVARDGVGSRRVRVFLTWFGWTPQRRYMTVMLTGPCVAHQAYTGRVVADLGYDAGRRVPRAVLPASPRRESLPGFPLTRRGDRLARSNEPAHERGGPRYLLSDHSSRLVHRCTPRRRAA